MPEEANKWEKARKRAEQFSPLSPLLEQTDTWDAALRQVRRLSTFVEQKPNDRAMLRKRKELHTISTTEKFEYEPLPQGRCIRLLTVEPAAASKVLRCSLRIVDITHNPDFTALSYSWERDKTIWDRANDVGKLALYLGKWAASHGLKNLREEGHVRGEEKVNLDWEELRDLGIFEGSPTTETPRTILCNGKMLQVQPNLYNALLYFRSIPTTAYWIDAVCINQKNLIEKTSQIQMMGQIYSAASRVLIWLGELPTPLVASMDRVIQCGDEKEGSGLTAGEECSPDGDQDKLSTVYSKHIAITYLLSRRWFRRLWTVQEYVSARSAVFVLGNRHFSAAVITAAIQFLQKNPRIFEVLLMRGVIEDVPLWQTLFPSIPRVLQFREQFMQGQKWTLAQWLDVARGRKASDTKDIVFAGLSLVETDDLVIDQHLQLSGEETVGEPSDPCNLNVRISRHRKLWSTLHADCSTDELHVLVNLAACILTRYGWEIMFRHALRFREPPVGLLSFLHSELPLLPRPSWIPDPSAWSTRVLEPFCVDNSEGLPLPQPRLVEMTPKISPDGLTLLMGGAVIGKIERSCLAPHTVISRRSYPGFALDLLQWLAEALPSIYLPSNSPGLEALLNVSTIAFKTAYPSRVAQIKSDTMLLGLCFMITAFKISAVRLLAEGSANPIPFVKHSNENRVTKEKVNKAFKAIKKKFPDAPWFDQELEDMGIDAVWLDPDLEEKGLHSLSQAATLDNAIQGHAMDIEAQAKLHRLGEITSAQKELYEVIRALPGRELQKLFMTDTGYLGMSSSQLQDGDSVFLISGGSMPYIFTPIDSVLKRRAQQIRDELADRVMDEKTGALQMELKDVEQKIGKQDAYQLVGEACIEGVMKGEVAAQYESKLRTFRIV